MPQLRQYSVLQSLLDDRLVPCFLELPNLDNMSTLSFSSLLLEFAKGLESNLVKNIASSLTFSKYLANWESFA